MKIQDLETKVALIKRLKRIEGQLRGVQNMLEQERDCKEIMQQLTAIHAAVQSTSRTFLQDYASACLAEMDGEVGKVPGEAIKIRRERIVQDMIQLLDKTP